MNIQIRIPREIYQRSMSDLVRPHPFAHERVGFFTGRTENASGGALVLINGFHPIPDDQYIADPDVGARISGTAIRDIMQRILDTDDGAFHVHLHSDRYPLGFSRPDLEGYRRLFPSLRASSMNQAHGAVVLNSRNACGLAWLPKSKAPEPIGGFAIVGFPMTFWRHRQ